MVTKAKIVEHWQARIEELGPTPEKRDLSENECFACGDHLKIERAHIEKAQFGGSMGSENLHLLCRRCHTESELFSGGYYWAWLRYQREHEFKPALLHTIERLDKAGVNALQVAVNAHESGGGDFEQAKAMLHKTLLSTVWKQQE
jgi:hypothetical protein